MNWRATWGRWAFARLVAVGTAAMIGAMLEVWIGSGSTQDNALLHWAMGATIVALGGVCYLITHDHWDIEPRDE